MPGLKINLQRATSLVLAMMWLKPVEKRARMKKKKYVAVREFWEKGKSDEKN